VPSCQLGDIASDPPRLIAREQLGTMSALPPKADIVQHGGNVRFVPKADISRLLDHLVGEQLHRVWKCQT
jgi:hypothetical protein